MTTAHTAPSLTVPADRGGCPFSPPPDYQQAREESPVSRVTLWDGSQCWMVTGYQELRSVLGDPRFSADAGRPGFPFLSAGRKLIATRSASFIRMDDPDHRRLRRMLSADFMIRKVEALRPRIQQIVDGFLDTMIAQGDSADLVSAFALPVPSLVICLLLGVPYEDHEFFQSHSHTILNSRSTEAEISAAQTELIDYLVELTGRKRQQPGDDVLSRLAARGELSTQEIAAMARLLLVAGHETTANMIGLSTLLLLRTPDQLARLRADPSLVKGTVEELLRYLTIVQSGLTRVAVEDVEVGGRTIRAGEGVLCMISAANRDPNAFPGDADEPGGPDTSGAPGSIGADGFDVGRDARHHVAFGFGIHQCLGQPLARVELQVALETLLRRLPGLSLAIPFEEVRFRHDMLVHGVHELPVAW